MTEHIETIKPFSERPHNAGSGVQKLYRFDNGYGASVVRFTYGGGVGSYGADAGLWEMAVIRWTGEDHELVYDAPVTDDVMGHLSDADVEEKLAEVRALVKP